MTKYPRTEKARMTKSETDSTHIQSFPLVFSPWKFGFHWALGISLFVILFSVVGAFDALGQSRGRVIRINPNVAYNLSSRDDIAQLKNLAAGVGWEFEPNEETSKRLKAIGIKRIRCINVDVGGATFDAKGVCHLGDGRVVRLLNANLDTCRVIGASPHVIFAVTLPEVLKLKPEHADTEDKELLGLVRSGTYGPTDWSKFRAYIKAMLKHVMIDHGFPDAAFEVGNEPEGGALLPRPPRPAMGSRAMYEAYLKLYSNVAAATEEFEAEHPDTDVTLGGPAGVWAYSFKFGDFNWTERFLRDVNEQQIKLDFVGIHFYGNISPLTPNGNRGVYPSYTEMFAMTRQWRDKYTVGVPIYMTEWGASYHTSLDAPSVLYNGGHVGASFAAAFLNRMLIDGVDKALYLVSTDLREEVDGTWTSIWGWPSLFTNPIAGPMVPKAPYHVFQMVHRLAPIRIEATHAGGTVDAIASRDSDGRITILVWNHSSTIPEFGLGVETGQREAITCQIVKADGFFNNTKVHLQRSLVSETVSNARYLFEQGGELDARAELQQVDQGVFSVVDDMLSVGFAQPPSSVSFIELSPLESD